MATTACVTDLGGTFALWNAATPINAGLVRSATITAAETASSSLSGSYSSDMQQLSGVLAISNHGNVTADYATSAQLSSASSLALASATSVRIWPAGNDTTCTTPGANTDTGTWAHFPTLSGSLMAGATVRYCVLTVLTSSGDLAAGSALAATITSTLTLGGWSSPSHATVTQSLQADAPQRSAPDSDNGVPLAETKALSTAPTSNSSNASTPATSPSATSTPPAPSTPAVTAPLAASPTPQPTVPPVAPPSTPAASPQPTPESLPPAAPPPSDSGDGGSVQTTG
ncbi:hypothetical protein OSC27_05810 [Microbacterium sp. STN6]|uniref:hypothetical protein n=1 Tax=Microbacterium sp. STN6 TaxID=2995588 RepID=UPI0022608E99|nr:hypothetical protein [Microbacterium sp. STN6]MCX7521794.1 hypothetical protein [Microbacterium sp. STN6]